MPGCTCSTGTRASCKAWTLGQALGSETGGGWKAKMRVEVVGLTESPGGLSGLLKAEDLPGVATPEPITIFREA